MTFMGIFDNVAESVMVVPSIAAEADKTLELIRTHDPGEGHVPLIPHSWMEYLEVM